jgi:energy-coupling factor transporter ATP-binding protein EcfA2
LSSPEPRRPAGSDGARIDTVLIDPVLLGPMLRAVAAAPPTAVVLIDGPSGAGKSTLADALVAAWPGPLAPTLVRLDDIYPGWNGLAAGIDHVATHLLAPRRRGLPAAWRRFDWNRGEPAEWHPVDPSRPLVARLPASAPQPSTTSGDIRVWLAADDSIRKARALDRDGATFRSHWDQWQDQWEAYRAREDPERRATIRLQGTVRNEELRAANVRELSPPD